jgi:hypothetical protein
MFANHEKLAASNRHQSRERTESQEALRREGEESQRPRANESGLGLQNAHAGSRRRD